MTAKEFNIRLINLGVTAKELIPQIKERAGLEHLRASEIYEAKHGWRTGPKSKAILAALDEILTEIEISDRCRPLVGEGE